MKALSPNRYHCVTAIRNSPPKRWSAQKPGSHTPAETGAGEDPGTGYSTARIADRPTPPCGTAWLTPHCRILKDSGGSGAAGNFLLSRVGLTFLLAV